MIMPTKYLKEDSALIGVGGILLRHIDNKKNLSSLWDEVKTVPSVATFERFVLALDFLYLLGLIDIENNEIKRVDI